MTQAATLDRLFKAQADTTEEIQTSTCEVADSVLSKLGLSAAGRQDVLDRHQTLAQIRTSPDITRA
jgi:hypothetical protein